MNREALDRLLALAALKAGRDKAELASRNASAAPIHAALRQLGQSPPLDQVPPDARSILQGRHAAEWEVWRAMERRRLTMALARHEAAISPIRLQAARSVAREKVIQTLRDRAKR